MLEILNYNIVKDSKKIYIYIWNPKKGRETLVHISEVFLRTKVLESGRQCPVRETGLSVRT